MAEDKRLNESVEIRKKRHNFVMIDNSVFNDKRLSWKAKGILAYLLSKPNGWQVIIKDIVKHSTDGVASVYAGLRELKEFGYYSKTPIRNEKGKISEWQSVIYEDPTENPESKKPKKKKPGKKKPESVENRASHPLIENQQIENQQIENQLIENRQHSNIDISNTDISNTEQQQPENPKPVVVKERKDSVDITELAYISELSDTSKASVLQATGNDTENIRIAYEMAKQQGNIDNLAGWMIGMVRKLQNGEITPSVEVKRQTKNRFNNFKGRDYDISMIERMEQMELRRLMGTETV